MARTPAKEPPEDPGRFKDRAVQPGGARANRPVTLDCAGSSRSRSEVPGTSVLIIKRILCLARPFVPRICVNRMGNWGDFGHVSSNDRADCYERVRWFSARALDYEAC